MRAQSMDGDRGRSSRLADHMTPFVRNEWYVAGLSQEIGRELTARKLLGVEILLYRREDGVAVALRNRCPHRSFPLSKGRLEGDVVVCGYHGLAFADWWEPTRYPISRPSGSTIGSTLRATSRDHRDSTARRDLFHYIEGFYNPRRLHLALGYISPADMERRAA